jgi:hypothetical protein
MDTQPTDQGLAMEDVDLNAIPDDELQTLEAEISKKCRQLETENLIFESFLNRIMPGMANEDLGDIKKDLADVDAFDKKEARRDKKKKADKKESDRPLLLTLEQKNEIAIREVEELRDVIQKQKEEWAKVLDNYKVPFKLFLTLLKRLN